MYAEPRAVCAPVAATRNAGTGRFWPTRSVSVPRSCDRGRASETCSLVGPVIPVLGLRRQSVPTSGTSACSVQNPRLHSNGSEYRLGAWFVVNGRSPERRCARSPSGRRRGYRRPGCSPPGRRRPHLELRRHIGSERRRDSDEGGHDASPAATVQIRRFMQSSSSSILGFPSGPGMQKLARLD